MPLPRPLPTANPCPSVLKDSTWETFEELVSRMLRSGRASDFKDEFSSFMRSVSVPEALVLLEAMEAGVAEMARIELAETMPLPPRLM